MKKAFLFLALAFILLATIVTAIGGSTRTRIQKTNVTLSDLKDSNCEEIQSLRGRIKCRLIQRAATENSYASTIDSAESESCRGIDNPERCRRLYKKVAPCYILESREKLLCLQEASGITKSVLARESSNETAVREYLVALLYELQGRAEKAAETERITPDEAAEIIEKIVNIKKEILDGEDKPRIKTLLGQLKSLWRSASIG